MIRNRRSARPGLEGDCTCRAHTTKRVLRAVYSDANLTRDCPIDLTAKAPERSVDDGRWISGFGQERYWRRSTNTTPASIVAAMSASHRSVLASIATPRSANSQTA